MWTKKPIPSIDKQKPKKYQTATFGLGCFWKPDGLFGVINGVIATRVGYAGGTSPAPTYYEIGDHIETLQIDFNPKIISYLNLLNIFWDSHNATREPWKRQYQSAVLLHNKEQLKAVSTTKQEVERISKRDVQSDIAPFKAFYLAEDYHQKYKLQKYPILTQELRHYGRHKLK